MSSYSSYPLLFLFLLPVLLLGSCRRGTETTGSETDGYDEPYRPQFHFTPAENWMNDPNGLVYHDGEYHLFYQYNPFGDTWGHMSWGHAVSTDLVHWKHLPVALEEENNVMIFSGSAVVDHGNTSGFGTPENPPMVAIYTGHHTDRERQDQRIAYSTDNGRTWTKYGGNPVLDEGMANFRDPKVFWHEPGGQWVMVVALPQQYKVRLYGSDDLKEWQMLSEFGPSGATGGIWECPDLFPLTVEETGETKWILQVDLNPGGPFGGSGSQYFVGQFDGTRFIQDEDTRGETRWVDYGKDFYAVQSYANIPETDGRRIWISWMNNWQYAQEIPTHPWRSAMTIPRSLTLRRHDGGVYLRHQPVRELHQLRGAHHRFEREKVDGASSLLADAGVTGNQLELVARFDRIRAERFGIKVAQGDTVETVIGYDAEAGELYIDRLNSGITRFNESFGGIHRASLQPVGSEIKLHIFVDWSSVELFGNDGLVVLTDRIFPTPGSDGISLFAEGGPVRLLELDIWELDSAWH